MVTLHWGNTVFTADKAVKDASTVTLYDERNEETQKIINIYGAEWNKITLDGEWTDASAIPSKMEMIEAQMMYTAMMTDTLLEE